MEFHEAAIKLRQEAIKANEGDRASKFDVWALLSIRYGLRVVGLRVEFYKMAADSPETAKMLQPGLERRQDMAAADDLVDTMDTLDSHMMTQLIKAVATLKASNAGKKSGSKGRGGPADGQ